MKLAIHLSAIGCIMLGATRAEVAPVAVSAPEPKVWTGQKLTLVVELRSRGSFAGSASFSLPEIPRTVIMKLDSVVVSSEELEGESWFVQRHEFALFSQHSGPLQIPEFPVRFGSRDGFSDPVEEITAEVPAISVEIQRPPGSGDIGFLITTDSLDVSESWDPQPGSDAVEVGAIFKRTVVQRASQMTGMALIPAPLAAPEGIRVYPPKAETSDRTERGEFSGERRETITYLVEKPGTLTLPEIRYAWWDPEGEKLESKVLPAVTIEVAAPPATPGDPTEQGRWRWWLPAAALTGLLFWQRARIRRFAARLWRKWHPPERVARRALLRACHRNDAPAASQAWYRWRETCPTDLDDDPELKHEATALQRQLYGRTPGDGWNGSALAAAIRARLKETKTQVTGDPSSSLPKLN